MSFWREPFSEIVKRQLTRRTKIHHEGRILEEGGTKGSEQIGTKTRSNDWYQFMVSRTAFLRISPTVVIKDQETLKGDQPINFAQHFVLEGVPLIKTQDLAPTLADESIFKKGPQFPSNPSKKGNKNTLLNNPTLRTSPDEDGFGIVPPPGVVSFSTQTKSFYGNVRAAKVTIRCFSLQQLNVIEKLYSRPGHHMFIEWGWNQYSDYNMSQSQGKSTIKRINTLITDLHYGRKETFDFWGEELEAGELQREIAYLRKEYQGNYDGLLGIVDSFSTKVEKDGGYTVDISLISRSELINSLKINKKGSVIIYDGATGLNQEKFTSLNSNFKPGDGGATLEYTELETKVNAKGEDIGEEDVIRNTPTPSILRQYIRAATFNAINTSAGGLVDEDAEGFWERAAAWTVSALIGIAAVVAIVATGGLAAVGIVGGLATAAAVTATAAAITAGVYYSGLGGALTPDWTDGLSDSMIKQQAADIEFGKGMFRPYIDWILMSDPNTLNAFSWSPIGGEEIKPQKGETHSEIGLGPYIRLGTLLRFINHMVIPHNQKRQPLVYCTNMSYNDSFDPLTNSFNPDESPYSIIPNSYSVHPLEYTYRIVQRLIMGEVLGLDVTILKTDNILSEAFWNNYKDGKQTSVILSPSRTIDELDEKIQESDDAQKGHSYYFYGISKEEFIELFKYCTNVRSATPSKVIFPHEFRKVLTEDQQGKITITGGGIWDALSLASGNYLGAIPGVTFSIPQHYQYIQHSHLTQEERDAGDSGYPILDDHYWDFLSRVPIDSKGFEGQGNLPLYYVSDEGIVDKTHGLEKWNDTGKNGDPRDLLASISFRDNLRYLAFNKVISKGFVNEVFKHIEEVGWKAFLEKLHSRNLGYDRVRNIDNIMINLFHLDKFLDDSPDLTLNDFLKEICDICNDAMGGAIDLKVVSNPMYNEAISIQDMRVSAYKGAKIKDKYFKFPKIGYGSLYKNLNITGKIPSAMAASIAIAAQDPKDANTIEQITYKNFLTDIEDRIIKKLSVKTVEELQEEDENAIEEYSETVKGFLRDTLFLRNFYKEGIYVDAPHLEKSWFSEAEGEASNTLRMATEASNQLFSRISIKEPFTNEEGKVGHKSKIYTYDTPLPYGSIIPLEVSLSMEGISGIFTANVFRMQKGTLPIQYNTDNVVFLVNGVKESVKGLTWSTDIKAQLIIINDKLSPPTSLLDGSPLVYGSGQQGLQGHQTSIL